MRPVAVPAAERPPGYPAHLERVLDLPGGRVAHLRPLVPGDAADLEAALDAADAETVYLRFFTPRPRFSAREIRYLTEIDYHHRLALVAFDEAGRGIAIGRYEATDEPATAEVAVVVDGAWRRAGLARTLIASLAAAAEAAGFRRLVALVLADNEPALALMRAAGFGGESVEDGIVTLVRHLAAPAAN